MALDLAKLTQSGVAAATAAGVSARITITRPAPPPNPTTGVATGTAVPQSVPAIPAQGILSAKARDAAWSEVRTALFVATADTTFAPQRADLVAFAGQTLRVLALEAYAPTGVVIGWYLGVGA